MLAHFGRLGSLSPHTQTHSCSYTMKHMKHKLGNSTPCLTSSVMHTCKANLICVIINKKSAWSNATELETNLCVDMSLSSNDAYSVGPFILYIKFLLKYGFLSTMYHKTNWAEIKRPRFSSRQCEIFWSMKLYLDSNFTWAFRLPIWQWFDIGSGNVLEFDRPEWINIQFTDSRTHLEASMFYIAIWKSDALF